MKYMKLSDIKIKESFVNSIPKEEKVEKCRQFWNTHHKQDRYILLNHRHTLVDGYIQYLVLKENNVETAEVQFVSKKKEKIKEKRTYRECETTYVYGIHPNSKSTKERVWRVPNSWWQGWAENLKIGDTLLVHTRYGLAPIEITKIERLNKCPVKFHVKTVYRKSIN